ncbi:MAG: DUF1501 domain-containing protein, partial [Planctomycetaceae bacterium]
MMQGLPYEWAGPSATRREFLGRSGLGMGLFGLAGVLRDAEGATGGGNPMLPREPQFPARAKHVIHIFLNGGPSH